MINETTMELKREMTIEAMKTMKQRTADGEFDPEDVLKDIKTRTDLSEEMKIEIAYAFGCMKIELDFVAWPTKMINHARWCHHLAFRASMNEALDDIRRDGSK